MNQQIEKLIDDAKLTAVSEMFEEELKKFAELIVKECAVYAFSDEQDHNAMLKHFGIKE